MRTLLSYSRRAAAVVVLTIACLAAGHLASRTATGATVNCTTDPTLDAEERTFFALINDHRAQNGKTPLAASYRLSLSSQWKSNDMGVNQYFAHDDQSRTWVQRVRDCGYGYNTWLGENIAAGISSAQQAFDLWKNSSGHNANMLGDNYTTVGIGRAFVAGSPYGWYWTTDFGGFNDGFASAGGPAPPADRRAVEQRVRVIIGQRSDGTLHIRAAPVQPSTVAQVAFYVDGRLVGVDSSAPFIIAYRPNSARHHPSIEARAVPRPRAASAMRLPSRR